MRCNNYDNSLTVIQGDTLDYLIALKSCSEDIDPEDIEHLYFSSRGLNITKELIYNPLEEAFELFFSSEETLNFPSGNHNFDLTIYSESFGTNTCVYKEIIKVFQKSNEVIIND